MKKTVFLLFTIALMLFVQINALACGCFQINPKETIKQRVNASLKIAHSVFIGEVISVTKNPESFGYITKLKVEKSWKEYSPQEVTLVGDGSSCEYHFEMGKEYLVYAYTRNQELTTDKCIGNRELEKAAEELKILGKGKKPQKIKQNK